MDEFIHVRWDYTSYDVTETILFISLVAFSQKNVDVTTKMF